MVGICNNHGKYLCLWVLHEGELVWRKGDREGSDDFVALIVI